LDQAAGDQATIGVVPWVDLWMDQVHQWEDRLWEGRLWEGHLWEGHLWEDPHPWQGHL